MERKVIRTALLILLLCLSAGCGKRQDKTEKLQDLEFKVLSQEQLPQELLELLEEKKEESFKMSFTDGDDMYICVGYGKQPTGGYSIAVTGLYEAENAVYIHTSLLGPSPDESKETLPSFPYVAVKLRRIEKAVVFE